MRFRHIVLVALALTVGFVLVTVLSAVLLGMAGLIISYFVGDDWHIGWGIVFAVGILWKFLPDKFKALHRIYEIRGEVLIDAPLATVWETVLPQPGLEYHSHTVTKVTAVEGEPKRVDLHTDGAGLDGPLPPLEAVLEEVEPYSYFRMSYLNIDAYPLWAGDLVKSEYFLERAEGKTRVTLIETVDKLRISTVLSLFALNPCRDAMQRVKALCEGTRDESWMTWMQENLDNQEGSGVSNGPVGSIGIMVCVFLTLFVIALVFFILNVVAPT